MPQQLAHASFDLRQMERLSLATTTQRWLFLAFFVAFAVKVPIFPLHTWLPDAHTEAPTNGSIVLAALLLKAGPYGLLRFNLDLFPEASRYFADAIGILAVVGIVYGAIVAMMQTDVKRLVAYSSVSHMGFVILGIFTFTMQGTSGAVTRSESSASRSISWRIGTAWRRSCTASRRRRRISSWSSPRPCTSHVSGRSVGRTRRETLPTSSARSRSRCPPSAPASAGFRSTSARG
jgi:hypothetical protein